MTKFKEKGEWYYIEFEREDGTPFDYGYIHKSQLKKICKNKVAYKLKRGCCKLNN